MIEGIGVDVVEIARMQKAIDDWGNTFLEKIFTEKELSYARARQNSIQHFAGRFAVKEAVAKALTTGWSEGFRWKDVEIENDKSGKPSVKLYGHVSDLLRNNRVFVSISHSENVVVGFAVIESPR